MTKEPFQARELDVTRPTAARLYDYFLGGKAHYDVDKVFAERMFRFFPHLDAGSHHNRGFLRRACRYLAGECGIRQFIDIGSGIPTVGNTHHVVAEVASGAHVVYVDKDLEVVNQSYDLLSRENAVDVSIIEADLRYPESILDHPETRRLIDFREPVGLVMGSVWLFVSDDDRPYELMACYRHRIAPGSYVAMTHHSVDEAADEAKEMFTAVVQSYDETADPITLRGREQFAAFFDGLTIVEPGVVYAADWRPEQPADEDDLARPLNYAAVARKP